MPSAKGYNRAWKRRQRKERKAVHDALLPILKEKARLENAVLEHLRTEPSRVRQASLSRSVEARKCYLCEEPMNAGDVAWAFSARKNGIHVSKLRRLLRMSVCDECARNPTKAIEVACPVAEGVGSDA
jgi:hypothetical protein